MSTGIYVACLTLVAAITAAFSLTRVHVDKDLKRRVLMFFVIVACLAPVVRLHLPMLIIGTVSLLLLLPSERALHIPFCLASLLVTPGFFAYAIPFPGINYLIRYELWMAAAWLIFLPLIFRHRLRLDAADIFFFAYVLWMIILDFRGVSVTQGIRQGLIHTSWLVLPYLAVSRSLRSPEEQARMIEAIVVVAMILCCATVYTQIVGWQYLNFSEGIGSDAAFERRFGLLRTGATLPTGLFGLICAFALVTVICRRQIVSGTLSRVAAVVLLTFGILASGARGAMVGSLATGTVWLLARRLSVRTLRMAALVLVVATPAIIGALTSANLNVLGDQGNISYRQRLLAASMQQIQEAPLLGDKYFLRSPHLAHMVQGQGIIDIVNSYLQMVLAYGIVGLSLFALAAYFVVRGVVRHIDVRRAAGIETEHLGLLLAFLAGFLFLIATTSQTSYVAFFGAVLLGLGRAAGVLTVQTVGGKGRSR